MPLKKIPYSASRLLRMCQDWSFDGEVGELMDLPDGEPRDCRAKAQSGHSNRSQRCPLSGVKRTSVLFSGSPFLTPLPNIRRLNP
jgi:hypothetical protein